MLVPYEEVKVVDVVASARHVAAFIRNWRLAVIIDIALGIRVRVTTDGSWG